MRFIEGMSREIHVGDARTQAAVERRFETMGEALNRLHQNGPEIAERVPSLRAVVGFRNSLIHGQATVRPDHVRDYTRNDLHELCRIVRVLLAGMAPLDEKS